jgi:hypothetical protein
LFWPFSEIYRLVAGGGANDNNEDSLRQVEDGSKSSKKMTGR